MGVKAVKCVKQNYDVPAELLSVMEQFREMVNRAIAVGLEQNITSRFKLSNAVYGELHNGLHTHYILGAVEKATAILRNYRKALRKANAKGRTVRMPYVRRAFLSLDNQSYRIIDGVLRIPTRPRHFIEIPLNDYTLRVLSQPGIRTGSVTLTAFTIVVSFSKESIPIEPALPVGIDRNLENMTAFDGEAVVYDLSPIQKIQQQSRETVSHFKRNDVRIRRKIASKYGRIRKNRSQWILNNVSKRIIERAKERKECVILEDIKDIRSMYRKGNRQGRDSRFRMNGWTYNEIERQLEYKAAWEGVAVYHVRAGGTSSLCAVCGSKIYPNSADRTVFCKHCRTTVDRDVNASINIFKRGMRFVPVGPAGEAVKWNPDVPCAPMVIHGADAGQVLNCG